MAKKTLNIEGMTCASCAKAVERATRKLEGVEEANVNLATEKLFVTYDEGALRVEDIQAAVEKAGYKAITESLTKTLSIEGMT